MDIILTKNNQIQILFKAPWTAKKYQLFIKSKELPEFNMKYIWQNDSYLLTCHSRYSHLFNLKDILQQKESLHFPDNMFDYQIFTTRIALQEKRYANWMDTGLGKTFVELEFGRQVNHKTGGKFLFIVPLSLQEQTIEESEKYYGKGKYPDIYICQSREDLKRWLIDGNADLGMVNAEKFIPNKKKGEPEILTECQNLSGVSGDEFSILKSGGGTIKWALIKSCKGIEYKLSMTATPAPNDTMEYASQGSWLERIRSEGEVIWKFFVRGKDSSWKVKDYAKDAFYRFMSSWSVYLRRPDYYGFKDNIQNIPKPEYYEYKIEITDEQRKKIMNVPDAKGQLSLYAVADEKKIGVIDSIQYSELAKGFIYKKVLDKTVQGKKFYKKIVEYCKSNKPEFVAKLIRQEVKLGLKVIVWTQFNEESEIIENLLKNDDFIVSALHGKVPSKKRHAMIKDFKEGRTNVIISKDKMLGFGQNLQICGSMIESAFNFSFEGRYQRIRRALRTGQTKILRIHTPYIPELEGHMLNILKKKEDQFMFDVSVQEDNYRNAMKKEIDNFLNDKGENV